LERTPVSRRLRVCNPDVTRPVTRRDHQGFTAITLERKDFSGGDPGFTGTGQGDLHKPPGLKLLEREDGLATGLAKGLHGIAAAGALQRAWPGRSQNGLPGDGTGEWVHADERDPAGVRILKCQYHPAGCGLHRCQCRSGLTQRGLRRDLASFGVQHEAAGPPRAQPELAFGEGHAEGRARGDGVGVEAGKRAQGRIARVVAQGKRLDSSLVTRRPDDRARRRRDSPVPAGPVDLLDLPDLRTLLVQYQDPPAAFRRAVVLDDDKEPADTDRWARNGTFLMPEILDREASQAIACQNEKAVSPAQDIEEPALLVAHGSLGQRHAQVDCRLLFTRLECNHDQTAT